MFLNKIFEHFLRVASRAWIACGIACLLLAPVFGIYTVTFIHRAATASGSIVRLIEATGENNETLNYAPVFAFTASNGYNYTVTSSTASNPPEFTVGQVVQVLYEKSNPSHARLASFWQLWFLPVLLSGLGTVFSGAGYLLLRYECRRKRRAAALAASL
ncbi:MAG: DUF3592 domain-containing protein [Terracidiphilus sp.]